MKKVIYLLAALCLFACISCKENCSVKKPPKNIKAIDWENYNDVETVFYNTWPYVVDVGKEIKVYGWVHWHGGGKEPLSDGWSGFDLVTENHKNSPNSGTCVGVEIDPNILNSVRTKFDSSDIANKCYIRGCLSSVPYDPKIDCGFSIPDIYVTNVEYIYFEK